MSQLVDEIQAATTNTAQVRIFMQEFETSAFAIDSGLLIRTHPPAKMTCHSCQINSNVYQTLGSLPNLIIVLRNYLRRS